MSKDIRVLGHGYSYWIEILTKNASANAKGLYLVFGIEDLGRIYHLYKMAQGEKFYDKFAPLTPGQWVSGVVGFKPIPEFNDKNAYWKTINLKSHPNLEFPYSGIYVIAYNEQNDDSVKYAIIDGVKGKMFIDELCRYSSPFCDADMEFDNQGFMCRYNILGYYYSFTYPVDKQSSPIDLLKPELIISDDNIIVSKKPICSL